MPTISKDKFDEYLSDRAVRGREGDALAAVEAAICIWSTHDLATDEEARKLYEELIGISRQSADPELSVCIADEMASGKFLKNDWEEATDFYLKSGYKGEYALGRLFFSIKTPVAKTLLKKAARSGHVPSIILYRDLMCKKIPLLGKVIRLALVPADAILYETAIRSDDVARRFWRYKDIGIEKLPALQKKLPIDRLRPFKEVKDFVSGFTADVKGRSELARL